MNFPGILIFRGSLFAGKKTLNNISQVYQARGDYDTALRYLEQSLKITRQIGDIAQEAVTCFNMAKIFTKKGQIEKAIPLVERTVEIEKFIKSIYLEKHSRYLMELRRKVSEVSEVSRVSGDKKEGSWEDRKMGKVAPFGQINACGEFFSVFNG